MYLTEEMIKTALSYLNGVYGYGICEETIYQNHWVRLWFCRALQDIYKINIPFFIPTANDIKRWKIQTIRKQKLDKINDTAT